MLWKQPHSVRGNCEDSSGLSLDTVSTLLTAECLLLSNQYSVWRCFCTDLVYVMPSNVCELS